MFFMEFCEKHQGNRGVSRRIWPDMEQAVGIRIDSGVQPILLIVELNHGFVDRNVIRVGTVCGL